MISVAFDSETYPFFAGNMTPRVVCGSWAEKTKAPGLALRETALDYLEALLNDDNVEVIGQHLPYDLACASAARPRLLKAIFRAYDHGRIFDLAIAEALYDIYHGQLLTDPETRQPIFRYTLAIIEKRLLGIDRAAAKLGEDAWRLRYRELDGIPVEQWPPEARQYVLDDAKNALDCALIQKTRVENLHHQSEQARAAWALYLSSVWGIRTDPKIVEEVAGEIEKGHHEALARFAAVGLFRSEGPKAGKKDTNKLARMVAEAYGAKDPCALCKGTGKTLSSRTSKPVNCPDCHGAGLDLSCVPQTATGKVCCNEDTLKQSGSKVLEDFAGIGENEKFFSTYLPIIRRGALAPINPDINVLVDTGRCSYRNPNLQNQPRNGRIRECYCARCGKLYCSCDYSTLELVTLAQVCIWYVGYSNMADAINAGRDLHAQFGAGVLGIAYDAFMAQLKAGDKTAKAFRQMSKAANFGLPGGLGASALVNYARVAYNARFCELSGKNNEGECGRNMTKDRHGNPLCADCFSIAKDLRSSWFSQWTEVGKYHEAIQANTDGPFGGFIVVPGADPNPGPGLTRGNCHFCDGANTGFQGLAARGAKAAMYEVSKECYTVRESPLYGTRPVAFVHDEIIGEVSDDPKKAHAAAFRMSEVMVEVMRVFTPDVAVKCEPALMKNWYKGAEAIFKCAAHPKEYGGKCCDQSLLAPWAPCSCCKGSGKVKVNGEKVKCAHCAGHGYEPPV